MTFLPNRDFLIDVSLGLVSGYESDTKYGRNLEIDIAAAEDIVNHGGNIFYPTTARTISVVSTSDEDDQTIGDGAWDVTIIGLDANYALQEVNYALNGQSAVVTTETFIRVFRMYCGACGTTGSNAGTITATYTDDTETAVVIDVGIGQTEFAALTIPDGKFLVPIFLSASLIKTGAGALVPRAAHVYGWAREYNASSTNNYDCWRRRFEVILNQDGTSNDQSTDRSGPVLPPRTDVRFQAAVTGDDTELTARFQYMLVDSSQMP